MLEGEVFDDPKFKRDARPTPFEEPPCRLCLGSLSTKVGPIITPARAETSSAVSRSSRMGRVLGGPGPHEPRRQPVALWSPGGEVGDVKPGSYTHMTEFFGPVLAVLKADNLEHAIELTNQTGYGLTSGLESLDEREHEQWREGIQAGNLYINRVTTGAIVQRQPFGGMGKSAFGPGIKAGGPNYVAQLMDFTDQPVGEVPDEPVSSPEVEDLRQALRQRMKGGDGSSGDDARRILAAIASYDRWQTEEFGAMHDHQRLVGQDNYRRYLPCGKLRVRVTEEDDAFELFARVCAAKTVGCHITVSKPKGLSTPALTLLDELTESWGAGIEFVEESDAELAATFAAKQTDRVRYAGERAPVSVLSAVQESGVFVARAPVLVEGRVELLWYIKEQSISHDYHRYGNLGARGDEERASVD